MVFPRHSKKELLLKNILNVDQSKLKSFEYEIIDRIGVLQILKYFKIEKDFKNDSKFSLIDNFYYHIFKRKGWDRSEVLKKVIKLKFTERLREGKEINGSISKDYSWMSIG